MLDRIFHYRRRSSSESSESVKYEDCQECRIIGGGGLLGLGTYIVFYSFKRRNIPTANKLSIFASSFVGSILMTLGTLRLLGLDGFSNHPNSNNSNKMNSKE